jgi:hypothetical protein
LDLKLRVSEEAQEAINADSGIIKDLGTLTSEQAQLLTKSGGAKIVDGKLINPAAKAGP